MPSYNIWLLAIIIQMMLDCLLTVQEPQGKSWWEVCRVHGWGNSCWNLSVVIPQQLRWCFVPLYFWQQPVCFKILNHLSLRFTNENTEVTYKFSGRQTPSPSILLDTFLRAWKCLHTATYCFYLLDLRLLCSQQGWRSAPLCLILHILPQFDPEPNGVKDS